MPDAAIETDEEFETPEPTPKPKVAKNPEPEPEPVVTKHKHVSRLVREALAAGLTQDDLDNHPSNVIAAELDRLESVAARRPAPTPKPEEKKVEPVDEDEEYLKQLATEYPPLAKIIRKALAKGELPEDVKSKLAKVDVLEAAEQNRQRRAFDRALDDAFAALPEEYHEFIGTGGIADLSDPGHLGYRGAIYKACKFETTDTKKTVAAKVLAAATTIIGPKVKQVADTSSAYDRIPAKPQPKDKNGRFTKDDYANGQVHRPSGRKTGLEGLSLEEGARRIMKEHGDPRGDRPVVELDDDEFAE